MQIFINPNICLKYLFIKNTFKYFVQKDRTFKQHLTVLTNHKGGAWCGRLYDMTFDQPGGRVHIIPPTHTPKRYPIGPHITRRCILKHTTHTLRSHSHTTHYREQTVQGGGHNIDTCTHIYTQIYL